MPSLTDIEGIGPSLAAACVKNDFRTIAKIASAKPSELVAVPGISEKRASQIIASAKSLLPRSGIPTATTKNKKGAVGPPKIRTKGLAAQVLNQSPDVEKKMSAKEEVKAKIKKLKKKLKKLKSEKKKLKKLKAEKKKSEKLKVEKKEKLSRKGKKSKKKKAKKSGKKK